MIMRLLKWSMLFVNYCCNILFQLTAYLSKKAGNEFRRMPYKLGPSKFCEYMDNEKMFIPEARKVSNYPPIGTCPWFVFILIVLIS